MSGKAKTEGPCGDGEFLAFDAVTLRLGEKNVFAGTHWIWRAGEQWAMLGPDGSGKSLFIEAILGRAIVHRGEVRGPHACEGRASSFCSAELAHVSPQTQRELALQESSFYQLRWHSSLEQGPRTVAQFLSQDSVEDRNPFEAGARSRKPRTFLTLRKRFVGMLGISDLLNRRLIHLSNGEMRKTLLVHALLKSPCLLILEDPYTGLDAATRRNLRRVVPKLMPQGWPVMVATNRPEEIPAATTHLLLLDGFKVIAQGPKRAVLRFWQERFEPRAVNRGHRDERWRPFSHQPHAFTIQGQRNKGLRHTYHRLVRHRAGDC